MSIRDVAYSLCKDVWNSTSRVQIQELILSLRNGMLHYLGHHQFAQLLGYLVVDQERERFETGLHPTKVFPLTDEQRQILASAHNQIVELNRQCVAPLIEALPKCAKAVDPYNKYDYRAPSDFVECDLLPPESIKRMASAFHNHPQITIAIENSTVVSDDITEEVYISNVLKMTDDFVAEGPLKYPKWLDDLRHKESKGSRYRAYIRHLAALTSIRESLAMLNQLIDQKIFYEKLLVLDEEYIIKSGPYSVSTAGTSMVFQFAGIFYIMEAHDIILAKIVALPSSPLQLCRVERFDMPPYPGEPAYVELRAIDEHLNPYFALVRSI